ncbi:hypothetical protein Fmac_004242 [Flemingia macrophylla]|uniref:Uncharacterized protein n=1 Tax=Flemingia macrophylla TaxID=520843 RepID=A0ABD1N4C3_9FABA
MKINHSHTLNFLSQALTLALTGLVTMYILTSDRYLLCFLVGKTSTSFPKISCIFAIMISLTSFLLLLLLLRAMKFLLSSSPLTCAASTTLLLQQKQEGASASAIIFFFFFG